MKIIDNNNYKDLWLNKQRKLLAKEIAKEITREILKELVEKDESSKKKSKNKKYESGLISDIIDYIEFSRNHFGVTPKQVCLSLDFFAKYTLQDKKDYNELVLIDSIKNGSNEYILGMKVEWM